MNKINLLFSRLPRLLDDPREDAGGHAEKLQASGGEVIPGRSGEYIIFQDRRLIEKARTYDDATRNSKVIAVIQRRRLRFNAAALQQN
jgi:hypothetical protein